MAVWLVRISGKGIRRDGVEKLAKALADKYGEEKASIIVTDATPPESRAERFSAATSLVSDAKGEFEQLRDELTEWKDGMPENLQDGAKADELQEAIDALEELIDKAEDVEGGDVTFPSMM